MKMYLLRNSKKSNEQKNKKKTKKVKANDELQTIFFFVGKIPWGGRKKGMKPTCAHILRESAYNLLFGGAFLFGPLN